MSSAAAAARGGAGLFEKFVRPFLKAWKPGKAVRGVVRGEVHEMPGMVVKDLKYTKKSKEALAAARKAFDSSGRRNFLKSLDEKALLEHGFTPKQVELVKAGKVPQGYQVHHIHPLDDGGTNDFSNLVLIKNNPDHQLVTNHQAAVAGHLKPGQTATVPWPEFPPGTTVWPPKTGGAHPIPRSQW